MGIHKIVEIVKQSTAANFTGRPNSLVWDDVSKRFFYHDGATAGGFPVGSGNTTLTYGATVTLDASQSTLYNITLTGNATFAAPVNLVAGQRFDILVKQDGTGSRTITWNSVFKWAGGTAPTLSITANALDEIKCITDGTNVYASAVLNLH